jgi:hypothetical protein
MSKEPKYQVLESYKKIELRLYEPFLVAEVETSGMRKDAIRSGFRMLANYLFGNNTASIKLPMSIPVTQQKISDKWKVRFMLAEASDLDDLPQPNNSVVKLLSIPEKKFAVIRFSGVPNDKEIENYTQQLRDFASSHQWILDDKPILAFYNPPWTLPFLRRNEVLIEMLG